MRRRARDDYDDPIDNLRREPEITTRDVADLFGVTSATVRRWVSRGHLTPIGKVGPSHLFETRKVLDAHRGIEARQKATGRQPLRRESFWVELRPIHRIRSKHHDAIVEISEAAQLIEVSPATIRSWIHRGHLVPLASSRPRATRLRLGDVIATARSRHLPTRSARLERAPRSGD